PEAAGPRELAGCPAGDRDDDGLFDHVDACPDEAGTLEHGGCTSARRITLGGLHWDLEFGEKIQFEIDKARIKAASYPLMDELVALVKAHPEWTHIQIEGHSASIDDDGRYSRSLSQVRATSVERYLVDKGVEAWRLEAVG